MRYDVLRRVIGALLLFAFVLTWYALGLFDDRLTDAHVLAFDEKTGLACFVGAIFVTLLAGLWLLIQGEPAREISAFALVLYVAAIALGIRDVPTIYSAVQFEWPNIAMLYIFGVTPLLLLLEIVLRSQSKSRSAAVA